jgi:UDP-N-acetylglucosamine--N-acetylmuramyl-(pentapeptide) pyrophosphoryl-undecaprenol N-acetylglucosamine transferase
MAKKIVIAGGGTGGHIFPAIAIANALKKVDNTIEFLFVGAKGKMEMEKVPQAGFNIKGLDIAGFNRSSLIKNITLPLKLIKSFLQVRSIFKTFCPDVVIGVGGYASFPVLRFAQARGIKTFIHESNSFAGKSNILLGKKAVKVFTGTDGMQNFFPADKIIVTGNPVRNSISNGQVTKKMALDFFSLAENKQTILVLGGSLGAKSINEAVHAGLGKATAAGVQIIWQTGKLFAQKAIADVVDMKGIWASDFISKMEYAYSAADVVIARAGAMTVAELCTVKKPVIFVPYPFAAEDHQTVNAMQLVNKQAAKMVKDATAATELMDMALALVNDKEAQEKLIKNITPLGIANADERIAEEIVKNL